MFDWKYPNRKAELAALRSGKILTPPAFGLPDIDYTNGVDWKFANESPPPVRWWLNHLKYIRPLLLSPAHDDLELASKIIKDWVVANSQTPQSDFAWDGHAVAFRSEQIACLKSRIDAAWLDDAVAEHAEFLCAKENYQGDWNHGLDQNIGLLSLGYASQNPQWIELARERSIVAISKMVDWQGVSIEQAVSYHFYNYVRFEDAEAMFKECGAPLPPDIFEQVHTMTTFVAHATLPNGKWNPIGDTTDDKSERERLQTTDAGFALSQGMKGQRPANRFAVYQAGYVFGRTGWGDTRPFDEETYYSLRFGPGRLIHGHNDHTSLTYYSRKTDVLIDGGFHGYTTDKFRDHLRSPSAHNVVYTTDKTKFYWNAKTEIVDQRIERLWQNFVLKDKPYADTERTRSVLLVQAPFELILVFDRVTGPKRRYEQAWHFADTWELVKAGEHVEAHTPGAKVHIKQLWPTDTMDVVKGQDEPPQGWAGYGVFDLRPIPTLISSRRGGSVTFLTAMCVQANDADMPEIIQQPIKRDGISRSILIKVGSDSITARLMDDDTIVL